MKVRVLYVLHQFLSSLLDAATLQNKFVSSLRCVTPLLLSVCLHLQSIAVLIVVILWSYFHGYRCCEPSNCMPSPAHDPTEQDFRLHLIADLSILAMQE